MHTSALPAPKLERPFPALTPAQRLHLEVNGYVVVPDVLSADECAQINDALHQVQRTIRQPDYQTRRLTHQPFDENSLPHHSFIGGLLEAAPILTAFATHPRLVGLAEEVIGGAARLVEYNAHINSRDPNLDESKAPDYGLHTGVDVPFGAHVKNDLFHCNFVKTLTTLVDLGPDDGGTMVIAGSHKIAAPQHDIAVAALRDPTLVHQFIAPAGSTLLFSETTIHGTGQLRSDRERAIIICGYGASMYPYWDGSEMSETFKASVPENLRPFLLGRAHWDRSPRYRTLADEVDARNFSLADGWWPN